MEARHLATAALAAAVVFGSLTALAIDDNPRAVNGMAFALDGDTLRVGNAPVRLFGIDAPESRQTCLDAQQRSWACGEAATATLRGMLARDPVVTCAIKDTDRYKRTVAVCRNGEGDLGARLVSLGLAVAYRHYSLTYVDQEDAARAERAGMWAGTFERPWDWRKRQPR